MRKSDSTKLLCEGTSFKVYATNSESHVWRISKCQVCVEESTAKDDNLFELVEREHNDDYETE